MASFRSKNVEICLCSTFYSHSCINFFSMVIRISGTQHLWIMWIDFHETTRYKPCFAYLNNCFQCNFYYFWHFHNQLFQKTYAKFYWFTLKETSSKTIFDSLCVRILYFLDNWISHLNFTLFQLSFEQSFTKLWTIDNNIQSYENNSVFLYFCYHF